MAYLTRRSVLRGSVALGATRLLAAPHIAKAAATTATVWFAQGFVQDEDVALRKAVADYEKASGNKIELSIIPFAPERQKIISAITSGVVPDMMDSNPNEILQLYAWQDRLVDVSDVVDTQKAQFSETALQSAQAYNNVTKKRGFYGVPLRAAVVPCHIWRPLVEKAGLKIEDIPKTWDAYFDFFKKVQDNLRKQGERKVYGLGFQVTANGVDPYNLFMRVSRRLWRSRYRHQGRQAASRRPEGQAGGDQGDGLPRRRLPGRLRAAERDQLERRRRQQRLPREAHGDGRRRDAVDRGRGQGEAPRVVLQGHGDPRHRLPERQCGQARAEHRRRHPGLIPKGAKNVTVAKEFLKYFIQPKVVGEFVELGLGRWLPVMPSLAKSPFWQDPKDPHLRGYVQQGLLGPTVPDYYVFNLAMAEVRTQHVWSLAMIDVAKEGVKPEAAIDKAFKRIEEIFAKYKIA